MGEEEGIGYDSVPGLVVAPDVVTHMEMIKSCGCGAGWCGWDVCDGIDKARRGRFSFCRT